MRKACLVTFVLICASAVRVAAQSDPSLLPETTTRISEHVYAIMGFPNIAIVVGTRGTLVVDTGLGARNGATISRVVKKLSPGGLLYLTTTHFHPEHAAGGFPNDTILIRDRVQQQEMEAHGAEMVTRFSQQSAQRAELLANVKMRQPDIVFDTEAKVDLGGVTARLLWLGEAHTKGDELIFVEPDSTLISGDVVQNKRVPGIYMEGGTPSSWIGVLDKLAPLHPLHILPDHSDPGDGTLIAQERAFIVDLQTSALALKRQGVPAEDAGKRLSDEFKAKYPDWPNINGVAGFVQRVYAEGSRADAALRTSCRMKVVETGHQHPHTHTPVGDDGRMKRVLLASLALTLGFVVFETLAGFSAHSLALLSDAGHNFTDAFALLLAAFGVYLQARPGDQARTYGYQRAGVLAAFVNALSLVLLAAVLFYESYQRLLHPEPVVANTMMVVAAVALALNLGIAWALGGHGHHHHDLNVRAAWLHMAGDAASSAAIIGGALLIRYTGWQAIDPVLSILIGVAIVWSGWGIIRDSLNILLEGLPKGLQLKSVSGELSQLPGVIDVHDLHIWSLGSESRALSCHVLIDDMPPSESDSILRRINDVLCARFHITHTTIQFEHVKCILAETHCTSASQGAIQPAGRTPHRH